MFLASLPSVTIAPLQIVQYAAALLVLNRKLNDQVIATLKLPVQWRIQYKFKLPLLMFRIHIG